MSHEIGEKVIKALCKEHFMCDPDGKNLGTWDNARRVEIIEETTGIKELIECLRNLLASSEHRTRQHCIDNCEEYGNGTSEEHAARQLLEKY